MLDYHGIDAVAYGCYTAGDAADVLFYVEEARLAGTPALELGCGTGRVLIPVAEAGIEIVGLDRSPAMLAIAREKVARLDPVTQARIELVEGEIGHFSLGRRFNLVMILARTFLHLTTPEEQRQALTCVHEHLADGGRLVFNIFDPRLDIIAAHLGPLGGAIKKHIEFTRPPGRVRIETS